MPNLFTHANEAGDQFWVIDGNDSELLFSSGQEIAVPYAQVLTLHGKLGSWLGLTPPLETYDEEALLKVRSALDAAGLAPVSTTDVIASMQNAGILFRERGNRPDEPGDLLRKASQEIADLKAERDKLAETVETLRSQRDKLGETVEAIRIQRGEFDQAYQVSQSKIAELREKLAAGPDGDLLDRVNTLETEHRITVEKVQDLAEGGIVPPEQAQRAVALETARKVAQNLTPAGGFGKQGQEARQPDTLSLAHFILTGERDYVTREGEYVERYADHEAVTPTPTYIERTFGPQEGEQDRD